MLHRLKRVPHISNMWKVVLIFGILLAGSVVTVLPLVLLKQPNAERTIDYYENLINRASLEALNHVFSEDATAYQAKDDTPIDYGSYDFVIIGAGSTGSVIASRLSEVEHWNVLLLEAGTFSNEINKIPALYSLGVFSDYNWGFKSVPQTTACLGTVEQRCTVPRGRGIGGTSLINGLMYVRGHPADYDKWAELVGDPSWSYKNILKYYLEPEDFHHTDPEAPVNWKYHSTGGNVYVEHHNPSIQLKNVFLKANVELGYNITDFNSPSQIGASVVQYNTIKGKRQDQGTAYVLPALNRINLEVLTESYVTKIEIDNQTKEATGVIFTRQGSTYRVKVEKEVILSAGVISSPQILMLSGVGPREHLQDVGIPLVQELPVGESLRDHVGLYGIQFSSNMTTADQTLREAIEDYLNGFGSLTSNTASHVFGWYKSVLGEPNKSPDLELVIDLSSPPGELGRKFNRWTNETWDALWVNNPNASFYTNILLVHVNSSGTLKLNSSNPFHYPLIDYNFLSDPSNKDIDSLYEGLQFCLNLENTEAFKKINARAELKPLPACEHSGYLSKAYWYCYIRQATLAVFHPVGTCQSGTDPADAVVDSQLKVFGIKKLRVADASVFPLTISAHTHAPCGMIGEKISDVIKSTYNQAF